MSLAAYVINYGTNPVIGYVIGCVIDFVIGSVLRLDPRVLPLTISPFSVLWSFYLATAEGAEKSRPVIWWVYILAGFVGLIALVALVVYIKRRENLRRQNMMFSVPE